MNMQKRPPKSHSKVTTVLGRSTFAAISAVEGLKLSSAGRKRVASALPADQRRAEVLRAYTNLKARK